VLVFFEFCEGKNRVHRDGQNLGVEALVKGDVVAGTAQLFGANARKSLREKKEHDILTFKTIKRNLCLFGVVEFKNGRLVPCFECHLLSAFVSDEEGSFAHGGFSLHVMISHSGTTNRIFAKERIPL